MLRGNTHAFNAVAQDGYDPAAAEAAQRRLKDHQDIDNQQGHQRQLSGKAEASGELKTAPGAARSIADEMARSEEKERRRRIDDVMMLSAIDRAREYSRELSRQIGEIEQQFEARYGDAWREEFAIRILGPAEVPERREGESMEDYRERVEDALEDRLLDPETGEPRPEFANDPEYAELVRWAQMNRSRDRVDASVARADAIMSDPNATQDDVNQAFEELNTINELQQADQEMTARGQAVDITAERTNEIRENQATQAVARSELDTFGLSN